MGFSSFGSSAWGRVIGATAGFGTPGGRDKKSSTRGYQDPRAEIPWWEGGTGQSNEMDMIRRFSRKDRSLGYTEMLLQQNQGLQSLVSGFKNPFSSAIAGSLDEATAQIRGLRGGMSGIGADLRRSSLASTQGAQVAALNAARQTSGRGGTAFGGGTAGIATRAAQQAASQQNMGLTQAMLQGRQMESSYNLQQAGMESSMAKMMMDARSRQAKLAEDNINRRAGAKTSFMEMMTSIAGIGGNKQSTEQRKEGADLGILGTWSF